MFSLAQPGISPRCPYKTVQLPDSRVVKEADDFTIITTDGVTRNLYNTLDSGKTVFIDIFYTTCYYCQIYSPVIEEIYQSTGAGEGDIQFWGISNNLFDTNHVIDAYKEQYNITNPCAGPWGDGEIAFTILISGQNFNGFPTYCVICPDRTLYFDACYPPTTSCFNPFFEQCASVNISEGQTGSFRSGIMSVYPNPASEWIFIDIAPADRVIYSLEVTDLLGRKMYSEQEVPSGKTFSFNGNNLRNGLYLIRLYENGDLTDTHKLLISRH